MKDPKNPVKVTKLATDFISNPSKAPDGEPRIRAIRELHDDLVHYEMELLGKADRIQYDQIMPKVLTEEFMSERFTNFLGDCDLIVLLRDGDQAQQPLIGFVALKYNKIMGLYIRPEYRRDRVASGTIQHIRERYAFREMIVSCYFANEPAQEFYKALDFVATSHQVVDEKPLFVDYTWYSEDRRQELTDGALIATSGVFAEFNGSGVRLDDYYDIEVLEAIVRQCKRGKANEEAQERLEMFGLRRIPLRLVFGTKIEEGAWHEEFNANVVKEVPVDKSNKFAVSAEIDGQLVGYVLVGEEPNKPLLHYHVQQFAIAANFQDMGWAALWFGHLVHKYTVRSLTIDVIFDDTKALYRDLVKFGFQVSNSEIKNGKTHLRMEWTNPDPTKPMPYPR